MEIYMLKIKLSEKNDLLHEGWEEIKRLKKSIAEKTDTENCGEKSKDNKLDTQNCGEKKTVLPDVKQEQNDQQGTPIADPPAVHENRNTQPSKNLSESDTLQSFIIQPDRNNMDNNNARLPTIFESPNSGKEHVGADPTRVCNHQSCGRPSVMATRTPDSFGPAGPRCEEHGGNKKCSVKGCTNDGLCRARCDDLLGPSGLRCHRHYPKIFLCCANECQKQAQYVNVQSKARRHYCMDHVEDEEKKLKREKKPVSMKNIEVATAV